MSGGGGRHRAPIEMPDDDGTHYQIDHGDDVDVVPGAGDLSKYHPDGAMREAVVHHVVTAFLIVMVLGIGTWGYLTFKDVEHNVSATDFSLDAPPFEAPAGDAQMDRFRFALEVYYKLYEKYPPDLEALVAEGLLSPDDLNYPPGSSTIGYQRTGATFTLSMERTIVRTKEVDPSEVPPDAQDPVSEQGSTNGATDGDEADAAAEKDEESD